LKLVLLGREMVSYSRIEPTMHGPGEQTKTEKSITREVALVERTEELQTGEVHAAIPADAMHTLRAARALYTWVLKLEQGLNSGKRLEHEFEVLVLPPSAPKQRKQ